MKTEDFDRLANYTFLLIVVVLIVTIWGQLLGKDPLQEEYEFVNDIRHQYQDVASLMGCADVTDQKSITCMENFAKNNLTKN